MNYVPKRSEKINTGVKRVRLIKHVSFIYNVYKGGEIMAKTKNILLNWNNKTLERLANHLHYSEGRMSKENIISTGTKTLFYQLKKGGYIEEVSHSKGVFKVTDKFKRQYNTHIHPEARWGGSGSNYHAEGMNQIIKMLPTQVVEEHRIQTEEMLKEQFKIERTTKEYNERLAGLKESYSLQREELVQAFQKGEISKGEYVLQEERITFQESVLKSEKPVSVADLSVQLHKEELEVFREALLSRVQEDAHNQRIWENAANQLQHIEYTTQEQVEVCIEVITDQYSSTHIQTKLNYQMLCQKLVILVPSPR